MSTKSRINPYPIPSNAPYTLTGLIQDYIKAKGANEPREIDYNIVAVMPFQKLAKAIIDYLDETRAVAAVKPKPWWRKWTRK